MTAQVPRLASYDVVVTGGRCAGAATAMLLARAGASVLLVEKGRYGTDILSTHALMRAAVVHLHRWGVLPAVVAAGTPPVRRAAFHYNREILSFPIKPRDGVDALYAPRRAVLDRLLVDAARAAGAEVLHETAVKDVLVAPGGRVRGVMLSPAGEGTTIHGVGAGLVVGADGLASTLARLLRAEVYAVGRHAAGVVYTYWRGLTIDEFRWCYGPGTAAGCVPTNDGLTCVFAITSGQRFGAEIRHDVKAGYHRILAECAPEIAEAVAAQVPAGGYHGFPGQPGFFRRSAGPGWALVGDAGYFKDPLTAHGITDAFRDAELLARAAAAGSEKRLAEYQASRDAAARPIFDLTDEIASFQWDMDSLKTLHRALNEEMAREARAAASQDAVTARAS